MDNIKINQLIVFTSKLTEGPTKSKIKNYDSKPQFPTQPPNPRGTIISNNINTKPISK